MQTETGNHRSRMLSLCIPPLGLGFVASLPPAIRSGCAVALEPVFLAGIVALVVFALTHFVLNRVAASHAPFAVGALAFSLWMVALFACGWPCAFALALYASLWGACLHSFIRGCAWAVALSQRRRAAVCGMASVGMMLGGAVGTPFSAHIEALPHLEGVLLLLALTAALVKTVMAVRDRGASCTVTSEGSGPLENAGVSDGSGSVPPNACQGTASCRGSGLDDACIALADTFHLTRRERDVLPYLARGFSASYCARRLGLADATVRTHAANVYHKLGVYSCDELIQFVGEYIECPARLAAFAVSRPATAPLVGRPLQPASRQVAADSCPGVPNGKANPAAARPLPPRGR